MRAGGISGLALFRADLALPGHAPLKLGPDLVTRSFFEWIRTTTEDYDAACREQDRKGLHRLILETKRTKANKQALETSASTTLHELDRFLS